ncbi:Fc.00g072090.m01.CDS01 [Cosmosporella sp. VM-42]
MLSPTREYESGSPGTELRDSNGMIEQDLARVIGNLFLIGFEGTTLTKDIRELIEVHFVGAILLTSKNLKSGEQATALISSLQYCAFAAGHKRPLLIAIDQENGSINSLVDQSITQFPSAMGMGANACPSLTRQVATATAAELSCVGVNWIIGPVLDVLSGSRPSPLGVRAFGDDPVTVLTHGVETVHGFKKAGVACCGKHFPSYGDVEFADGTEFSLPSIVSTAEDLQNRAFIPFRACGQVGMDAILVGGCSINIAGKTANHACLERSVVSGILRRECQFDGVIVSECLAMEALCQDIGISQGTAMALGAGCDMMTICQTYHAQLEGISALNLAVKDGGIPWHLVLASNKRIDAMKDRCTSWTQALNPGGSACLADLKMQHSALSKEVYRGAISLVRDTGENLPRIRNLPDDKEVLLLTPLLELFPSTATRGQSEEVASTQRLVRLALGEDTFQTFGALLAEHLNVRLVHTSYSSNGLRPVHEELISRSSNVIILTADAIRNSYQYGVTKHAAMQCKYQPDEYGRQKPLVVVALSSPHDFLTDKDINTYICTYDFSIPSLNNLARLLAGTLSPTKMPPLALARRGTPDTLSQNDGHTKTAWLVEPYDDFRDRLALDKLLSSIHTASQPGLGHSSSLNLLAHSPDKKGFVVRNSSTKAILGIVVTLVLDSRSAGEIEAVIIDPDRKDVGIEESLREHALWYLTSTYGLPRASIRCT